MFLDILVTNVLIFFFFKQKTAYEMRISDWSSDVCSSDLRNGVAGGARHVGCDQPILAKNAIDQGGFADVRAADHSDAHHSRRLFVGIGCRLGLRQVHFDGVEQIRSAERRGGKGWVSTCRSRWSPSH